MKIKYLTLIALLGSMTACDPAIDEIDPQVSYSTSDLENSVEITQPIDGKPDVFSFKTNPSKYIQILDEFGSVIASGTSCDSFKVAPGVSGELTIRLLSQTGEQVEFSKSMTVDKYTDVPRSWYCITGNKEGEFSGSAEWVWDDVSQDGAVWGNAGYTKSKPGNPSATPDKWWGCPLKDLAGQTDHAVGKTLTGDESPNAKMVFKGATVIKYDGEGNEIATGTFNIKDVTDEDGKKYKQADLTTTNNTILWPYQINGNGKYLNSFEVTYIDENYMQLISIGPENDRCTWWEFKRKDAGKYIKNEPYEIWNKDIYSIVDKEGNTIEKETKVDNQTLSFNYVYLDKPFKFKAKTQESTATLTVPEGTTFVDITPANATIYKVAGKDTTEQKQTETDLFAALTEGVKYNVTVTYKAPTEGDKEEETTASKKPYSVYYSEYDPESSDLKIYVHSPNAMYHDKNKNAVNDTVYTGQKSRSGSITTYTFENILIERVNKDKTKDRSAQFYFYNNKTEDGYKELYSFVDITLLMGDENIVKKGGETSITEDGKESKFNFIELIEKLAEDSKDKVLAKTIVLSIFKGTDGKKTAYISVK
ncbi:MAG: hypothetical protein K6F33_03340 [Bacteroidales bacterium]|nr:hypothetical protein [Bacteroidales bacterium]